MKRSTMLIRRLVAATAGLAAMLVLAPASATAFEIHPVVTLGSTVAGANTSLQLDVEVDDEPDADLRDLSIQLPPGLIADPLAAPACTSAQLQADACPAATRVGSASMTVNAAGVSGEVTVPGSIYNLMPPAGEPARFGLVLSPQAPLSTQKIIKQVVVQLRQGPRAADPTEALDTARLDLALRDLPRYSGFIAIDIKRLVLTLQGQAGSPPRGFVRLPTSCREHRLAFGATPYSGQGFLATDTFSTFGCPGAQPFAPAFSAQIKRAGAVDQPVELSATITQGPGQAGMMKTGLVLPVELGVNDQTLVNRCAYASFQAGSCPPASIIGDAEVSSPLLAAPLTGPIALLQPQIPGQPEVGLDLRGPVALQLIGALRVTSDARDLITFHGLPDIPISSYRFTFAGGPNGLVIPDRDVCDPAPLVFRSRFDSHSGLSLRDVMTPASVDCSQADSNGPGGNGTGGGSGSGGGGGGPSGARAKIKLGRLGSDEPTMKLKVKAGAEKLRQAKLKLPRELAFAGGRAFDRGTKVKAGGGGKASAEQSRRALKLKTKKAAKSFVAKLADGALEPGQGLREGKRLKFKLKVRDAAGETTKLTVRAK